jgi:hypothetical protein
MNMENPMDFSVPEPAEWAKLYQAAIRIKEMAPWEWMDETLIFGVQDPETDRIGFVSVMGQLGEHYSVAVYLGPEALYDFWRFEEYADESDAGELLEIPHLQASFEDRDVLNQQDRNVIKELGLKFRGRQAWPMFRSYRPGFFPWYVDAREARILTRALEQTLVMAPRIREDPALLELADEESHLVRTAREESGELVWEDRIVRVSPPEPKSFPVFMDRQALEWLMAMEPSPMTLEMDLSVIPVRIGDRGSRPRYAHMLLIVERESGFVFGSEMLTSDPTPEAMYGKVPATIVRMLARSNIRPAEVKVSSLLLYELLDILSERLGFRLGIDDWLPSLETAKAFLSGAFLR